MLNTKKAFSSFSVNDIQKAREFYARPSGSNCRRSEGTLVVPLSGDTKALIYPKPNHQPPTFTVLNFSVESVEKTVDELSGRGVRFEVYNKPNLKTDTRGISRCNGPTVCVVQGPGGEYFVGAGSSLAAMQLLFATRNLCRQVASRQKSIAVTGRPEAIKTHS